MNYIDSILNRITMYRVVLYGLVLLVVSAFLFNLVSFLDQGVVPLLSSLTILLLVCGVTNYAFARYFKVGANVESVWITAFILFLVVSPASSVTDALFVALAGFLAIASKFVLTIGKKHLFNPVAISLVFLSLMGSGVASWWVATPHLFPVALIVGLLVVRKTRRFDVWIAFLISALAMYLLSVMRIGAPLGESLTDFFLSWPVLFFSTVMLTEPLTMPGRKHLRIVYGIIVGLLFSSTLHFWIIFMTPELALVLGNIFAYIVGSRQRLLLTLISKEKLTSSLYEFKFTPDERLQFLAGQYIEWTLPHNPSDSRGNRRFFTIASAPEDPCLALGVRIDTENHSSFKHTLQNLKEGNVLWAGNLGGDFILPTDTETPLVWIAGGIGITPFISMLRHLLITHDRREITLFYAVHKEEDIAYRDVLERGEKELGMRFVPIVGTPLTAETLGETVGDLARPTFYLSGPQGMVTVYKKLLRSLSIPHAQIKTDYFPGF
jgi:glycine betaine catabolism B